MFDWLRRLFKQSDEDERQQFFAMIEVDPIHWTKIGQSVASPLLAFLTRAHDTLYSHATRR
jgi:hypothetical protein